MHIYLRTAAVMAAIATSGVFVSSADATPSQGVSGVILAKTTVGATDYILREITIAPGGSTGWHFHDGPLYVVVRSGILSHYGSDCRADGIRTPGAAFYERGDSGYVHIGRNRGVEPVVLDVLYTLPTGKPLSEDAPAPGCHLDGDDR